MNRRSLLKLVPSIASGAILPSLPLRSYGAASLSLEPAAERYAPLQQVSLRGASSGAISVLDGAGNEYFHAQSAEEVTFKIGGALGRHVLTLFTPEKAVASTLSFEVDCKTELKEESSTFEELLRAALWTMMDWNKGAPVDVIRYSGRVYQMFVNWVFDHTITLKGMKYYWPELKDAVDFFAETQREDGMIWENCYPATPPANYFDWKFAYGDFVRRLEGGFRQLRRAPVESHVEQYFVEALYDSWKATGDTDWMATRIDHAIRALGYATSDPYRWSSKYQLMHRGFTIDTWDFTSDDQQKIGSDCVFVVYLGKSQFGVFYGDNTNLIAGYRRIAEMLQHIGRGSEAPKYIEKAEILQERLDRLAWNGNFYTHWIAEDPDYRPDVGVDMSKQVSLSNACSLNRGIPHHHCVQIIRTYQKIRSEMPASSPGEFYGIYPPFPRDFTQNSPGKVWEYVNGGVLTVVAAELAHGAFEHGFEEYAGDILRRQKKLADRFRRYLPAVLRGKAYEPPPRSFTKLPLRSLANVAIGPGGNGVIGWGGGSEPDLRDLPTGQQVFQSIPFDVINPDTNRRRCCLGLSHVHPYLQSATVPVGQKAHSVYLLHAAVGSQPTVGTLTFRYTDASVHSVYIQQGKNIGSWWQPHDTKYNREGPRIFDKLRVAWQKSTRGFPSVGVYAAGIENPFPDKNIESLVLDAGIGNSQWMVLGVTLSDAPVFFPPYDDLSSGIPDGWNAAMAWAVLEGLAGIKDDGVAFSQAVVAPRWESVGVGRAEVTVRYPASDGYCSYRYRRDASAGTVTVEVTGSARQLDLRVLLPKGKAVKRALLDGRSTHVSSEMMEQSRYAVAKIAGMGAHQLDLSLSEEA